jgi:YD repeat-containing protein
VHDYAGQLTVSDGLGRVNDDITYRYDSAGNLLARTNHNFAVNFTPKEKTIRRLRSFWG